MTTYETENIEGLEFEELESGMSERDWQDIIESEYVDFAKSEKTFGLIFEHPKMGLHGFRVDRETGYIKPAMFRRSD